MTAALVLGPVTFLSPLALLGLLALPIIWWILRITPPQPKRAEFPPLQILQDVMTDEQTPDSTPLWLLLFRLFLAALIAIALARPILGGDASEVARPLTMVIDDSWDAAPNWSTVIKDAEGRLTEARRANLDVMIVTTTSPEAADFTPAQEALSVIKSLTPKPLPPQRKAAADAINAANITGSNAVWVSSGLSHNAADRDGINALAAALSNASDVKRLEPSALLSPIVPGLVTETGSGFRSVWHNPSESARRVTITAHNNSGSVLARSEINFGPGQKTGEADFELPADLRNRVTVLRAAGLSSAGSVKLLDDSWGRPLVGVLTTGDSTASPLLSESYYTETALAPHADVFTGSLDELLPLAPSIIVMPDAARTDDPALVDFVEAGGLLIRFSGPKLAKRADTLLPVFIREGDRALGGALTWEEPQAIAPFSQDSPFFGLQIPDDIFITQQVMAEPGAQTDARTWARLSDGAPIVTSAPRGLGRIVLFHVTAGPSWSNLPVGGLYVDMLRRVLPLANATPAPSQSTDGDWVISRALSGAGRLSAPALSTQNLPDDVFNTTPISQAHPAGLYKQGVRLRARNMVGDTDAIMPIGPLPGVSLASFDTGVERTLGGVLLSLALMMLAVDVLLSLLASGRMGYLVPRAGKAAALVFATSFMMISPDSVAQTQAQTQTQTETQPEAVSDALGLHLAYVKTGNGQLDDLSRRAMESLSDALTRRTTIEPEGVRGVEPENDPLVFYPFLYYPVERNAEPLSEAASAALNAYMASGGTIVFDTRDQGDRALLGNATHPGLAAVTKDLDIPQIGPVPDDHVLTKSFYLIQNYPGRWAGGTVWVDKDRNGTARDGVSSVIIGANDWAAGWAVDETGQGIITLENDMARQREFAVRFGVNLAMYALSGNYKSDQVHAAALVERLGRQQRQPMDLGPTPDTGQPKAEEP